MAEEPPFLYFERPSLGRHVSCTFSAQLMTTPFNPACDLSLRSGDLVILICGMRVLPMQQGLLIAS